MLVIPSMLQESQNQKESSNRCFLLEGKLQLFPEVSIAVESRLMCDLCEICVPFPHSRPKNG